VATLRFHRGEEFIVEHRLRVGRTTLGRADTCDIALPGDMLSRVHAFIDGRGGRWFLVDRSRHGTYLKGEQVDRTELHDGDELALGPYRIVFSKEGRVAGPTDVWQASCEHEVLLGTDDQGVQVAKATLVVTSGPEDGRREVLRQARVSVGGAGSHIVLDDPDLLARHCWVRTSHGRAMVEPGQGAAHIDGERIRDVTPIYADESFRIGSSVLRVEQVVAEEAPTSPQFGEMVAKSERMQSLFGMLRRVAGHHHPVLVIGESGTGKELIAAGIHREGARAEGPFVPINCGALSEQLFESELFGHEKGAFTGADRRRDGAFHRAHGGTIFLDEVGELPASVQAKLLRVLESGEVRRVGSSDVSYPNVRVISATNRDLLSAVREGAFREDLFFRLNVLHVQVPPLRDRVEDLEVLVAHLCRQIHPEAHVAEEAMATLRNHAWPGNVRELKNVLIRAVVNGGSKVVPAHIEFHHLRPPSPVMSSGELTMEEAERRWIVEALERNAHNRSATARELGMARSTLLHKIKRHQLS
jgi:DNA-binding NtrC family response regulator